MAVRYGQLGTIDTLTVGGVQFVDLDNVKVLGAPCQATSRYTAMQERNGTSAYQVSGSTTLKLRAGQGMQTSGSSAGQAMTLLYGDTAVLDSASAPTTAVWQFGFAATTYYNVAVVTQAPGFAGAYSTQFPTFFNIPSNKYPHVYSNTSAGFSIFYGYDV